MKINKKQFVKLLETESFKRLVLCYNTNFMFNHELTIRNIEAYVDSDTYFCVKSCDQNLGYKDIGSFWYKEVIKYEQLKEFGCLCVKLTLKGKNSLILHTIG